MFCSLHTEKKGSLRVQGFFDFQIISLVLNLIVKHCCRTKWQPNNNEELQILDWKQSVFRHIYVIYVIYSGLTAMQMLKYAFYACGIHSASSIDWETGHHIQYLGMAFVFILLPSTQNELNITSISVRQSYTKHMNSFHLNINSHLISSQF